MSDASTALREFCKLHDITVTAQYIPQTITPSELAKRIKENNAWYLWTATVSNGKGSTYSASYRAGIGHGVYGAFNVRRTEAFLRLVCQEMTAGFLNVFDFARYNDYGFTPIRKKYTKRVKDHDPMYMLGCFLSDAQCGAETHEDFCANLGYDPDSRKGLEIYLECQKTYNAMRAIFGKNFDRACELASEL